MAHRLRRFVESLTEFISRFWPLSKSEERILEDQRKRFGADLADSTGTDCL